MLIGGLLVGLPEELPKCPFMSDKEFACYVEHYKKNGFQ